MKISRKDSHRQCRQINNCLMLSVQYLFSWAIISCISSHVDKNSAREGMLYEDIIKKQSYITVANDLL